MGLAVAVVPVVPVGTTVTSVVTSGRGGYEWAMRGGDGGDDGGDDGGGDGGGGGRGGSGGADRRRPS